MLFHLQMSRCPFQVRLYLTLSPHLGGVSLLMVGQLAWRGCIFDHKNYRKIWVIGDCKGNEISVEQLGISFKSF